MALLAQKLTNAPAEFKLAWEQLALHGTDWSCAEESVTHFGRL
jgi:hypothetical protein